MYELQQQAKLDYGSRRLVTPGRGVTNAIRDEESLRVNGNILGRDLGGDHMRIYTRIRSSNKV